MEFKNPPGSKYTSKGDFYIYEIGSEDKLFYLFQTTTSSPYSANGPGKGAVPRWEPK